MLLRASFESLHQRHLPASKHWASSSRALADNDRSGGSADKRLTPLLGKTKARTRPSFAPVCDLVNLPRPPKQTPWWSTVAPCPPKSIPAASSACFDGHPPHQRRIWFDRQSLLLPSLPEYGIPQSLLSLVCVTASSPNRFLAYNVLPHPNQLLTLPLSIAQELLRTLATRKFGWKPHGTSPSTMLTSCAI